jgi:hypothetical protein
MDNIYMSFCDRLAMLVSPVTTKKGQTSSRNRLRKRAGGNQRRKKPKATGFKKKVLSRLRRGGIFLVA